MFNTTTIGSISCYFAKLLITLIVTSVPSYSRNLYVQHVSLPTDWSLTPDNWTSLSVHFTVNDFVWTKMLETETYVIGKTANVAQGAVEKKNMWSKETNAFASLLLAHVPIWADSSKVSGGERGARTVKWFSQIRTTSLGGNGNVRISIWNSQRSQHTFLSFI